MNKIQLNNGNSQEMPLRGFGIFQITDQRQCEESVLHVFKTGYRMSGKTAAQERGGK